MPVASGLAAVVVGSGAGRSGEGGESPDVSGGGETKTCPLNTASKTPSADRLAPVRAVHGRHLRLPEPAVAEDKGREFGIGAGEWKGHRLTVASPQFPVPRDRAELPDRRDRTARCR